MSSGYPVKLLFTFQTFINLASVHGSLAFVVGSSLLLQWCDRQRRLSFRATPLVVSLWKQSKVVACVRVGRSCEFYVRFGLGVCLHCCAWHMLVQKIVPASANSVVHLISNNNVEDGPVAQKVDFEVVEPASAKSAVH